MKKTVWISAFDKNEETSKVTFNALHKYGLDVSGHFWPEYDDKKGWELPTEALKNADAWVILMSPSAFANEHNRFSLNLTLMQIRTLKGDGFPVFISGIEKADVAEELIYLSACEFVNSAVLGVKLLSATAKVLPVSETEYRLNCHAIMGIGTWFEVGPCPHSWQGAMIALEGAEIDAHGVGPSGKLPQKAILSYPYKGMKLEVDGTEFIGWGVENELAAGESYYIRIKGLPKSMLFGESPIKNENADLYRCYF
ncbi:hypothetical protein [Shewanella surugensis]|uniref:TIR domain-containing protein n=1 Tax=Shewanella surugensis TaxID=212020 RepID=A0ABT0LFJ5_9GAMM|nr:hypothetical protein [Shewanella surugensis]MCL1126468.1 hypothetical protein [Shewanella surugensis]